jgi:hypothetical protein
MIKLKKLISLKEDGTTIKDLISVMPYEIKDEGMFKAAYFGENALRYRVKKYPDINSGDPVYEMHIDITPQDQGKGLAAKMIEVFLYKEGGVAYFSHGRIINPQVYKVLDKIKQDPNWLVQDVGDGITVVEK